MLLTNVSWQLVHISHLQLDVQPSFLKLVSTLKIRLNLRFFLSQLSLPMSRHRYCNFSSILICQGDIFRSTPVVFSSGCSFRCITAAVAYIGRLVSVM